MSSFLIPFIASILIFTASQTRNSSRPTTIPHRKCGAFPFLTSSRLHERTSKLIPLWDDLVARDSMIVQWFSATPCGLSCGLSCTICGLFNGTSLLSCVFSMSRLKSLLAPHRSRSILPAYLHLQTDLAAVFSFPKPPNLPVRWNRIHWMKERQEVQPRCSKGLRCGIAELKHFVVRRWGHLTELSFRAPEVEEDLQSEYVPYHLFITIYQYRIQW